MNHGYGRKVGPSPGTPGPQGSLRPPGLAELNDLKYHRIHGTPRSSGPRIPRDLRTSGALGNYLYCLKFRI